MSFESFEESSYGGVPISLYEFSRGGQVWRYTNADSDQTRQQDFGSQVLPDVQTLVYTAVAISDGGIVQSGEAAQDDLSITLPWNLPVVGLFIGTAPSQSVYVKVFKGHFGDPSSDLAGATPLAWIGTVAQVTRANAATAQVTCSTLAKTFERSGLRLGWSRLCPYMLYDPKTCKVDRTLFATPGTITALDGVTAIIPEVAALPAGALRGGYIEWNVGEGAYNRRAIENHAGAAVSVLGQTDGLAIGTAVTAYYGCDRTLTTCDETFHNTDNNGSDPFLPGISPFDGNSVF